MLIIFLSFFLRKIVERIWISSWWFIVNIISHFCIERGIILINARDENLKNSSKIHLARKKSQLSSCLFGKQFLYHFSIFHFSISFSYFVHNYWIIKFLIDFYIILYHFIPLSYIKLNSYIYFASFSFTIHIYNIWC